MRASRKVGLVVAVVALLLGSCAPERGFVLVVKNSSGTPLSNVTVKWAMGSTELGRLSDGAEDIQFGNPLPIPSSVTVAWDDERAVAHEVVSEVSVANEDSRRVFLYFTVLPDGKVQARSSYELSVGNSNRP